MQKRNKNTVIQCFSAAFTRYNSIQFINFMNELPGYRMLFDQDFSYLLIHSSRNGTCIFSAYC